MLEIAPQHEEASPVHLSEYTTFDGRQLAYRYWPADKPRCAPVVYLHGIESHGGWFERTAQGLAAVGVPVYALDRRGSGRNTEHRGYCRAYEHLLLDVAVFVQQLGGEPVHLIGLSWGGKVALAVALYYTRYVRSLILITPGIFPRVGLTPRDRLRVLFRWLRNTQTPLPIPLRPELFSDDPPVRHYIDADTLRLTRATPQLLWESRRLDGVAQRVSACPVPLFAALSRPDRIIDTPLTEQWLTDLTAPDTCTKVYEQDHALPLECPDLLAGDVAAWIAHVEGEER